MKVNAKQFSEAVKKASLGTNKQSPARALRGILITPVSVVGMTPKKLIVDVPYESTGEWPEHEVVVQPNELIERLKYFSEPEITIERSSLTLSEGQKTATIQCDQGSAFPIHDRGGVEPIGALDLKQFLASWKEAAVSVSTDDRRPHLRCVHMIAKGKMLEMVSTDSYRLVLSKRPAVEKGEFDIVVPGAALAIIEKFRLKEGALSVFLGDADDPTEPGWAVFQTHSHKVSVKLIENERFPNHALLLPPDNDRVVIIDDVKLLIDSISSVAGPISKRWNSKPIALEINGELKISSYDINREIMATAVVPCEETGDDGDPLTIYFDPKFLLDGLKMYKGDSIVMEFKTSLRPVLMSNRDDETEVFYLLMPRRMS